MVPCFSLPGSTAMLAAGLSERWCKARIAQYLWHPCLCWRLLDSHCRHWFAKHGLCWSAEDLKKIFCSFASFGSRQVGLEASTPAFVTPFNLLSHVVGLSMPCPNAGNILALR